MEITPNTNTEQDKTPTQATESSREDAIWVQRAIGGDEKAYQFLMEKYQRALYYFILKMVRNQDVIEDLVQEVFMKAFHNINSYNNEYAFSTWIYRIATNHSIDFLRKKKLQTLSIDQPVSTKDGEMQIELPDQHGEADEEIMTTQRAQIIKEAIAQLPEKYRAVIRMRHMEELSYQEIAEITDLPLGTVKAHIFRAREMLYKYLKDKQGSF